MLTRKDLIEKYKKLARHDKEVIGAALVKVNLGVNDPADQRRGAAFLKGSQFIAKPETLDEVIAFLHDNLSDPKPSKDSTQELSPEAFSTTAVEKLKMHPEDTVVTSREKFRK